MKDSHAQAFTRSLRYLQKSHVYVYAYRWKYQYILLG